MLEKDKEPLISIIVITYNSAKYVLETLESAKNQTYKNIELVISDDCSNDNTVEICKNWLAENKARFVDTNLITIKENSGVPANCNRGLYASSGAWVKLIAGDDVLFNTCIQINIQEALISNKPLYFSRLTFFNKIGMQEKKSNLRNKLAREFGVKSQLEKKKSYLRYPMFINAPTFFYKKNILLEQGGFDEKYYLLEDQPYVLKLLKNTYDMGFINKNTVLYRVNNSSITGNVNINFVKVKYEHYKDRIRPSLNIWNPKDCIFRLYHDWSFFVKLNGLDRYKLVQYTLGLNKLLLKLV